MVTVRLIVMVAVRDRDRVSVTATVTVGVRDRARVIARERISLKRPTRVRCPSLST